MARKDENGVKHSKKSKAKENRKKYIYSQKTVRNKEMFLEQKMKTTSKSKINS